MSAEPQAEPEVVAPPEPEKAPEPDYLDQLLRLKAEFENFRKRTDKEKPEFYRMGKAEVVSRLLPIYDLLQRVHQDVQVSHLDTPLAKGFEGIFKEFDKLFKEEGILAMDPVGKPFDANKHEALGTVPAAEGVEDGAVIDVLQNGFMMQDKVLRTAKVRIAKNP